MDAAQMDSWLKARKLRSRGARVLGETTCAVLTKGAVEKLLPQVRAHLKDGRGSSPEKWNYRWSLYTWTEADGQQMGLHLDHGSFPSTLYAYHANPK